MLGGRLGKPACAVKALCPVIIVHVDDMNAAAAGWGMDEPPVTDVDADMRKSLFEGIEKHQITRLQLIYRNGFSQLADGTRAVRQGQVGGLAKYIAHETAAIEAGIRGNSAEFIRCPTERKCTHQDVLHG